MSMKPTNPIYPPGLSPLGAKVALGVGVGAGPAATTALIYGLVEMAVLSKLSSPTELAVTAGICLATAVGISAGALDCTVPVAERLDRMTVHNFRGSLLGRFFSPMVPALR
jgi:hypothetical protein